MIEVKTADLTGELLDCVVATILNPEEKIFWNCDGYTLRWHIKPKPFSTDWKSGGPLVDQFDVWFSSNADAGDVATEHLASCTPHSDAGDDKSLATATTKLIAAMRAIVLSSRGEVLLVPDSQPVC